MLGLRFIFRPIVNSLEGFPKSIPVGVRRFSLVINFEKGELDPEVTQPIDEKAPFSIPIQVFVTRTSSEGESVKSQTSVGASADTSLKPDLSVSGKVAKSKHLEDSTVFKAAAEMETECCGIRLLESGATLRVEVSPPPTSGAVVLSGEGARKDVLELRPDHLGLLYARVAVEVDVRDLLTLSDDRWTPDLRAGARFAKFACQPATVATRIKLALAARLSFVNVPESHSQFTIYNASISSTAEDKLEVPQ